MKYASALLLLAGLLWATGAGAQPLYKSVGPDGRVTYSDTPPAPSMRIEKKLAGPPDRTEALPPELAEAVKKAPVTLYTTDKCVPCSDGRNLLNGRGIPFTEKTVHSNDDLAALRQAGGDQQLPLLTVGRQKQQGFEADGWHAALTTAGYPQTSQLPKTYRNPPAQSAAPQKPASEAKKAAAEQAGETGVRAAPPAGNAPPGFRF